MRRWVGWHLCGGRLESRWEDIYGPHMIGGDGGRVVRDV